MRLQKERPDLEVKGNNNNVVVFGQGSFRDVVIVIVAITVLAVLFRCPGSLGELIKLIRIALSN